MFLKKDDEHTATASFGVARALPRGKPTRANRVQQIERELGRELTPREKFYLALSEAVRSNQITVKNARKQRDRELTTE